MKLGIVSQWFAPEQFSIPNSLSEQSVVAGDEVTVLTGFPSYPAGKIYDGYSQVARFCEVIAGADVYRAKSFLSHDASAMNRIRTFVSFALSSSRRAGALADVDVNYVYATPMTASLAAWWLRKRHGIPYVLHIQDLWPESVTSSGMLSRGMLSTVADWLISALLKPIYSAASHVVVISPTMKATLINRGVESTKISTVLNWDPDSRQSGPEKIVPSEQGTVRFVYAGNLGVMQDVENILRAAALLQDRPNIEIHIYGGGVLESSLQRMAADATLSNVTFHGRVTKEAMSEVYGSSDFLLVTLKDESLFRMTIPSKFQAAMAHGLPVVSTVRGDLEKLCTDAGVGWTAQPEHPHSLAEAIVKAAAVEPHDRYAMTKRCREFYRNELSPDKGIAAVRSILRDVAVLKGRNVC